MNDWSSRDIQRANGRRPGTTNQGLRHLAGPDTVPFATYGSLSGAAASEMTASVNGREYCGNARDMLELAAAPGPCQPRYGVAPGDVLGSGTVGTGCILD